MAKGGDYEREFCKQLSLWWTDNKHDDVFWRTEGSGGRATVRGKKGQRTLRCGDVCATHKDGEPLIDLFAIELKRGYAHANLLDLLDKKDSAGIQPLEEFWQQAHEAYENSGAYSWLLVLRRDHRHTVVFLPTDAYNYLRSMGSFAERPCPSLSLRTILRKKDKERIEAHITGVLLEHFFREVKADQVKQLAKRV